MWFLSTFGVVGKKGIFKRVDLFRSGMNSATSPLKFQEKPLGDKYIFLFMFIQLTSMTLSTDQINKGHLALSQTNWDFIMITGKEDWTV